MQVREQLLAGPEPMVFGGNGFLDLDDQVGDGEYVVS
jgi:hypothetical protein